MEVGMKRTAGSESVWRAVVTICGILIIGLTLSIGVFLIIKGTGTFTQYHHSVFEFLFSSQWSPKDGAGAYGGGVGAAVYIAGSFMTCALGLLIALPFSIAAAVYITVISPDAGTKVFQPVIEIFVGIPSVVYGWIGLTVLVPFIKNVFHAPMGGFSVLAAAIVLAIMIFPTITTVSADAIRSVPYEYSTAAYGLGSTRWQVIHAIILPAARTGIFTGIILGLSRALGEALAVAMVIGKTRAFPSNILSPTTNLTAALASDMGNTADGGEYNLALWSMALLLYIISIVTITLIHAISNRRDNAGGRDDAADDTVKNKVRAAAGKADT
jgi:phosphate transport system permease protein